MGIRWDRTGARVGSDAENTRDATSDFLHRVDIVDRTSAFRAVGGGDVACPVFHAAGAAR